MHNITVYIYIHTHTHTIFFFAYYKGIQKREGPRIWKTIKRATVVRTQAVYLYTYTQKGFIYKDIPSG